MNKTIVYLAVVILLIGGGWYWYGHRSSSPSPAAPSTQLANPASVNCVDKLGGQLEIRDEAEGQVGYCHLKDGRVCEEWALFRDGSCTPPPPTKITGADGSECHDSSAYFVITKGRGSEVGSDILVKRKTSPVQQPECAYKKAAGDIEIADADAAYFLGLTGDYLLLDHGTAPPPRGLTVYDLKQGKEVYSDRYNNPSAVGEGTFTYWQPTKTTPTAENCPDLATWTSQGLGAGIERRVTLDLATLKLTDLGETRCSARQ